MKKTHLILVVILLAALFLRVFSLPNFPVGFNVDEASFAYDAYSILQTGHDQWGHFMPLAFESFGDFKAPVLVYLAVPFVALMGLSVEAVRIPNALLGALAVWATYLLAGELAATFNLDSKLRKPFQLIAAALLAFSSWHIMMSRGAFEANLTTFFLPLGLYCLLKGLKKPLFLIGAAFSLGINTLTYFTPYFITPLLLLTFVGLYHRPLLKVKRQYLLVSSAVFLLFFGLRVYSFATGGGARLQTVNILQNNAQVAVNSRYAADRAGMPDLLSKVVHNKYDSALHKYAGNYLSYFSPEFYFFQGPGESVYGMLPGRGVLYWFEIIFLLGFLAFLFRSKVTTGLVLIGAWILLAPLPAAASVGPGYAANRVALMMPALQIILALGAVYLWSQVKAFLPIKMAKLLAGLLLLFAVGNILFFLDDYFLLSPYKVAQARNYGAMDVFTWIKNHNLADQKFIVSRRFSEPQIYVAFAMAWDPKDFQQAAKDWNYAAQGAAWVDEIPGYKLDNFTFDSLDWQKYRSHKDLYLIGTKDDFPENIKAIKTFYYPNGKESFLIVRVADNSN